MANKIEQPDSVESKMTSEAIVDTPTTVDLLGFKRFTDPIARRIAGLADGSTPLTIGVYGEWGSGKTSFLQMIDEALRREGIYPVWFNAWKYDKEDNLWSALLQTILDQARVSGRWYRRAWVKFRIWWDSIDVRAGLWEVAKKLVPVIVRSLLVLVSAAIVLGWSSAEIEAFLNGIASQWPPNNPVVLAILRPHLIKAIVAMVGFVAAKPDGLLRLFDTKLGIDFSKLSRKPTYREHIAFLDKFTKEFQRIIRLISRRKPLVVIIDDLDRCLPEKALQVLEAIKLFMDVQGCVFLLAVDREIIEKAIAVKYKDILAMEKESDGTSRELATFHEDYTEKIIQLPISLPRLSESNIARFIESLTTDEDIQLCASIFGAGLLPNPRKIKRALRAFLFVRDVAANEIKTGDITPPLLAKLVVIQTRFPLLYEAIAERPSLLEELEKYYHGQVEAKVQSRPVAQGVVGDPALRDRAEEYAAQYPQVRRILLQRVDNSDSFTGAPIERYITLVGAIAEVKPIKEELTPALGRYLRYMSIVTRLLDLRGVASPQPIVLDLEAIFIAPRFTTLQALLRAEPTGQSVLSDHTEQATVELANLSDVLRSSRRIVILGYPGSGKTTLLKYLASTCARAMIESDTSLIETQFGLQEVSIPIFLQLSEFGRYVERSGDTFPAPGRFVEFFDRYFAQWDIDLPFGFFLRYFERGKCLILLDGLDEVPPDQRYFIVESINALSARYPLNRYIVTSRTTGFQDERIRPRGFDVHTLAPWSKDQVSAFINSWLLTLASVSAGDTTRVKEAANRLQVLVSRHPELSALATNPLLLTVIVLMYGLRAGLPASRAALYGEAAELLLMEWDRAKGLADGALRIDTMAMRRSLASIALQIQQSEGTDVDEATILRAFAQELEESIGEVAPILTTIRERSGLLIERQPGIYTFVHRTFQEYFAALALTIQPDFVPTTLELWLKDGEVWREVILFEVSILCHQGRYDDASNLLSALLDNGKPHSLILASECLLEIGSQRVGNTLVQQILNALERLEEDEATESSIRARAKELKRMMQP